MGSHGDNVAILQKCPGGACPQTPLGGPARNAMALYPDVPPHFNLPSYASG